MYFSFLGSSDYELYIIFLSQATVFFSLLWLKPEPCTCYLNILPLDYILSLSSHEMKTLHNSSILSIIW